MTSEQTANADRDAQPYRGQLALVLPVPPSVNHQYATVQGRRVLSRAGRAYKQLVAEEIEHRRESGELSEATLSRFQGHYLSLIIVFYFAAVLRRDLDGGLKIAQDAICEALGVNDNLVVEIHLRKRVDRQHPRIEVLLGALAAKAVTLPCEGNPETGPVIRPRAPGKRRRGLRKLRSLDELARRYKWL
ncbi:hypothetical protein NKDENANG_02582 [Candidatus Entotheonellaceae bacterium PAL068K]